MHCGSYRQTRATHRALRMIACVARDGQLLFAHNLYCYCVNANLPLSGALL